MTVCMYRDIHTLQPYIIDFTQRGCHTLRYIFFVFRDKSLFKSHDESSHKYRKAKISYTYSSEIGCYRSLIPCKHRCRHH